MDKPNNNLIDQLISIDEISYKNITEILSLYDKITKFYLKPNSSFREIYKHICDHDNFEYIDFVFWFYYQFQGRNKILQYTLNTHSQFITLNRIYENLNTIYEDLTRKNYYYDFTKFNEKYYNYFDEHKCTNIHKYSKIIKNKLLLVMMYTRIILPIELIEEIIYYTTTLISKEILTYGGTVRSPVWRYLY